MKSSPLCLAITLLGVVLWMGCEPANPQNRQKVSGTVLLDGQPLEKGDIMFMPINTGATMSGTRIENGAYALGVENGLAPSDYGVSITAPDPNYVPKRAPGGGPPPRAPELIPPEYNSSSTQKVTVKQGTDNVFNFDIKSKKK